MEIKEKKRARMASRIEAWWINMVEILLIETPE